MKASVQYNDRKGYAAADIANINYQQIAERCNLDERYTIIGISLYGTDEISVSLICKDNVESTDENEILVDVHPAVELRIGEVLERLNVVINITNNTIYDNPNLDTDREHSIDMEE